MARWRRVPADATAFAHRDAPIMVAIIDTLRGSGHGGRAGRLDRRRSTSSSAARSVGVYSNFLAVEGDQRIREAYPGAAYARLADIKRRYDPSNLFSLQPEHPPGRLSELTGAVPGRRTPR